jgi:hypothetical protein
MWKGQIRNSVAALTIRLLGLDGGGGEGSGATGLGGRGREANCGAQEQRGRHFDQPLSTVVDGMASKLNCFQQGHREKDMPRFFLWKIYPYTKNLTF